MADKGVDLQINVIANTEPLEGSLKQMRQEIKTLSGQLGSGLLSPNDQQKIVARIAELKGKVQDLSVSITKFDPGDTFGNFATILGVGNTAMVAITNSLELFGVQEDKVKQIQEKLNKMIQIGVVLQQLADASRLKGMVTYYAGKIREFVINNLLIQQKRTETGETIALTLAQKAFNIALVSSGIGAFVVAIGMLVGYMMNLTSATDKQTEAEKRLNEEREKNKEYNKNIKNILIDRQVLLGKLSKDEGDLIKLQNNRDAAAQDSWDLQKKIAEFEKNWTTEQLKNNKEYQDLLSKKRDADASYNIFKEEAINKDIENQQAVKKELEDGLKKDKEVNDEKIKKRKELTKAEQDAQVKILELNAKTADDLRAVESKRWEFQKQELQKAIDIEKKGSIEWRAAKAAYEVAEAEHNNKMTKITEDEINTRNEASLKIMELNAKDYDSQVVYEAQRYALELDALNKRKATQEELELAEAQHMANLQSLAKTEVDKLKNELSDKLSSLNQTPVTIGNPEQLQANVQEQKDIINKYYDEMLVKAKGNAELEKQIVEDKNAAISELNKTAIDEEQQLRLEALNTYLDAYKEGISIIQGIIIDQMTAASEERISNMDSEHERQLKILEQQKEAKIISDQEYNKRKTQIDQSYELQIKAEKTKQAKAEKLNAIFRIALDTAMAYMKAVAAFPITAGQPFAGIALALGAMQTAAVIAKPIPKFQQGGYINGPSHAAGGVMLPAANVEGGEFIINKRQTSNNADLLNTINNSNGDMIKELSLRLDRIYSVLLVPSRSYVVESDITESQANIRRIKDTATI